MTIAVGDASVREGNITAKVGVEKTNMVFTVSLTDAIERDLDRHLCDGGAAETATAGVDYLAATGSVTIPAGSTSATLSVIVLGDNTMERNEMLTLKIRSTNAIVTDDTAAGTIQDDDGFSNPGGFGGRPLGILGLSITSTPKNQPGIATATCTVTSQSSMRRQFPLGMSRR